MNQKWSCWSFKGREVSLHVRFLPGTWSPRHKIISPSQNRHQEYFSKVQVDDDLQTQGEGVIRISSDGDDRMGEKVKSPKNPWDF